MKTKPIVFGGPSLRFLPKLFKDEIIIRPPVKSGDIHDLGKPEGMTVLISDGLFAQNMAITPTECREFIMAGGILFGTASMGAVRAADLWPIGMIGIGEIYNMYRLGYLNSDADVAVSYILHSSGSYLEISLSIVHIAFVLNHMERLGFCNPNISRKLLSNARNIHYTERSCDLLLKEWRTIVPSESFLSTFSEFSSTSNLHPKIKDTHLAIGYLLSNTWPQIIPIKPESPALQVISGLQLKDFKRCQVCERPLPATALFCHYCASYTHEFQGQSNV